MTQKLSKILAGALYRMIAYIRGHHRSGKKKVLREKQIDVFKAVYDFLKKGLTCGFIKLPTGTGKTVLFGQIIRAVTNGRSRAIIIAPRIQLVQQTYESLKRFAPELSVGRINIDHKEYDHQVIITTYTSWQIQLKAGNLSIDEFDYMILDEGHRALTPKLKRHIEAAKKKSIVFGFTATPGFSSMKHLKKLLEYEIYTMELSEAIGLGLLSGVRVMLVEVDVDLSETASKRGDYDINDLEKLINTSKVNHAALEVYQNYFDGECAIIYANSIQHVSDVVSTFKAAGIKAQGIYGAMPKKKREKILHDYHVGVFNVLVNCDLLIEGFDEPRVSVCLNLRPTQSVVLAEQRGGRVLRLDPSNTNKIAHVVDFIYKESSRYKIAVLFSQITGGAIVLPEGSRISRNQKKGRIRDSPGLIDIDGVKIIYDVHTVEELTKNRMKHNKSIEQSFYPTWQEASRAAIALGIKDIQTYLKRYKEDPRLPSSPFVTYRNFPGNLKFFGTEKSFYQTLKEASAAAKKLNCKSSIDYGKRYKEDPRLPRLPSKYYKKFPGWDIYLGIEKVEIFYPTWQQAAKAAARLGLKDSIEYRSKKGYKKDPKLPGDLAKYYLDFPGYRIFFGKHERYKTWQQSRTAAIKLGIKTQPEYIKRYREDPRLHSNPHEFYSNFPGYSAYLGGNKLPKNRKLYSTWQKASASAKKLKITSSKVYPNIRKKDPMLPGDPSRQYENFPGWAKFLGK